jgi:polyhydroxyalkanoate synthesis regulator phasin
MGYDTLTEFERALARFGDKVDLIVGLEVGGKINADEAYQQIKDMMKDLKKIRKNHLKHGKDLDSFGYDDIPERY